MPRKRKPHHQSILRSDERASIDRHLDALDLLGGPYRKAVYLADMLASQSTVAVAYVIAAYNDTHDDGLRVFTQFLALIDEHEGSGGLADLVRLLANIFDTIMPA